MGKYNLGEFAEIKNRRVFFDANVIIYIFWPTGSRSYEDDYSMIFSNLLKQENKLLLNFNVVSEVINRISRIEYRKVGKNFSKFKSFRNSQEGKRVIDDIYLLFKDNILPYFEIVGRSFSQSDVEEFLIYRKLDFNDLAIEKICFEHNLILLTHDGDFVDSNIDILTNNQSYFN